MATTFDKGMFSSPEQIMAAEQAARATQDPNAALRAALGGVGRQAAGAFGQALGGPGLPESPEIMLARTRQEAVRGLNPSDPNSYVQAAQNLYQAGDMAGATQLLAQKPEVEKPKYGIEELKEGTPDAPIYRNVLTVDGVPTQEISRGARSRTGPAVQVYTGAEKEEGKAKVRIAEKDYKDTLERSDLAAQELSFLQAGKTLLNDPSFETGAFEPLKMSISSYAESAGIDPNLLGLDKATNAQQFRGIMNNIVLKRMKALRPATDKDVLFAMKTVGELGNTKEANIFLNNFLTAIATQDSIMGSTYNDLYSGDTPLIQIKKKWRESPYKVRVVGQNKQGTTIFWNDYYSKMEQLWGDKPQFKNKDGSLNRKKLLNTIKGKWTKDYAIK